MKVVVIGGGASGMMAAYSSAIEGNQVVLLEQNEKLGKKIYITGKGRCNLTCAVEKNDFYSNVVNNSKFLFSAINALSPQDLVSFFESKGLQLKEERGKRIFPVSDKASDVTKTLEKSLIDSGVDIRLNTAVVDLVVDKNQIKGVITTNGQLLCNKVIICTGGISYPTTGCTGDGYKFAKSLGHAIVSPKPALVGIELKGSDYALLQGLSLKNVKISVFNEKKLLFSDFGEMLFTHYGVSGPIVLSCSSVINKFNVEGLIMSIDLKPALSEQILEQRLLREFSENNTKNITTAMRSLMPKSLINVVLSKANVSSRKNCSQITVEERNRLLLTLKNLTFSIKKLRPIEEAIITSGGVEVKQINPKTMESKLIKGLFFAGEVIDVDAFTGGFNLQIAFSTGFVAGKNL